MNPFHIYVDRPDIKRVPLLKVRSDGTLENKPLSAKEHSYIFLEGVRKKRDLDVSSVPAHDDECNCTETD